MLMSAKIGKKAYVNFLFSERQYDGVCLWEFVVCRMFVSDFTKGAESTPHHYGALKSPARIELI